MRRGIYWPDERLSATLLHEISQSKTVLKEPQNYSSNCMGCDIAWIEADETNDVSAAVLASEVNVMYSYYGFICVTKMRSSRA
jgi:hypothetical protein